MASHARIERGDGNGFPGGLRLSWPALSVMIGAVSLIGAGVGVVRWADLRSVDYQVSAAQAKAVEVDARREADRQEVRRELNDLRVEIRDRLNVLDGKLDRAIERQR